MKIFKFLCVALLSLLMLGEAVIQLSGVVDFYLKWQIIVSGQ